MQIVAQHIWMGARLRKAVLTPSLVEVSYNSHFGNGIILHKGFLCSRYAIPFVLSSTVIANVACFPSCKSEHPIL